jgi:hypothetical protein
MPGIEGGNFFIFQAVRRNSIQQRPDRGQVLAVLRRRTDDNQVISQEVRGG